MSRVDDDTEYVQPQVVTSHRAVNVSRRSRAVDERVNDRDTRSNDRRNTSSTSNMIPTEDLYDSITAPSM